MTLPPPWEEQRPLGPQIARWRCQVENGADLTVIVGPRGVELHSGPGLCVPVTTRPDDLWALAAGIAYLGDLIAGPREPAPAKQPTLFDEVPA